jgi:hypothetical protein
MGSGILSPGSNRSMPGGTQVRDQVSDKPRRGGLFFAGFAALLAGALVPFAWKYFLAPGPPVPCVVAIQTEPTGAQVTVDGTSRGVSPLSLELSAGDHPMIVEAAGWQRTSRVVHVPAETQRLDISLTLSPVPPPPPSAPAAEPSSSAEEEPEAEAPVVGP